MIGIDETKKIAASTALVLNTGSKLLQGKVLAVFELVAPFNILSRVDFDAFRKEIADLDVDERMVVEQEFASNLNLANKTVQQKLIDSADGLNDAVTVVQSAVAVVNDGLAVVNRFRAILGV